MRETKTGFGGKGNNQNYEAQGGLEGPDEEEDSEEEGSQASGDDDSQEDASGDESSD